MKMTKRLLALIFATFIIFTFAACSSDSTDAPPPTEADTTETGSDAKDDETITMERGNVDDNVYHNEVTGITFTKPEEMIYATDDEIAQTINVTKDQLNSSDLFETAAVTTVIDFMATDPVTRNNINVSYENLSKSNATNITVEQYIEVFKNTMMSMVGYEYTFGDITEINLGSDTYQKLVCLCDVNGITMKQGIYLRKVGKYMMSVTITVVDGTDLSIYEKCFS